MFVRPGASGWVSAVAVLLISLVALLTVAGGGHCLPLSCALLLLISPTLGGTAAAKSRVRFAAVGMRSSGRVRCGLLTAL